MKTVRVCVQTTLVERQTDRVHVTMALIGDDQKTLEAEVVIAELSLDTAIGLHSGLSSALGGESI